MSKRLIFPVAAALIVLSFFAAYRVQGTDDISTAIVTDVLSEEQTQAGDGPGDTRQVLTVRLLSGSSAGREVQVENVALQQRAGLLLHKGEHVVVQRIPLPDRADQYMLREKFRLPAIIGAVGVFLLLGVLTGGWTGIRALAGLAVSVGVLIGGVMPRILAGENPLLVCTLGAAVIAGISLYLAHGWNRRTSIALLSTMLTLVCSVLMALLAVHVTGLLGMGSEEAVFLLQGPLSGIQLRGLLLGGMIVGTLGVLDDITTAQTAAIDELSKANPLLGFAELYRAGSSIGREHIASLINTLALAYAGASMPLLLLFAVDDDTPWWVILNSEFLAEEVIRTLVGSASLLVAVPIATSLAARAFAHGRHTHAEGGHSHIHA